MAQYNALQTLMLRTAHLDEPKDRALSLCGLGLAGEAGEIADLVKKIYFHGKPFDRAKLIEEGGDLVWYAFYLAYVLDICPSDLIDPEYHFNTFQDLPEPQRFTRLANQITVNASELTQLLDRIVFDNHPLSTIKDNIGGWLAALLSWIEALAIALGGTLSEMCQLNIAKLEKRYPKGFNSFDSLARADEVVNQPGL